MAETPDFGRIAQSALALLDRIMKARQVLLQTGASVDGLAVRIHPSDYMTLSMESGSGPIDVDQAGAPVSILRMPFVQDVDISIGAPVVEPAQSASGRGRPTDHDKAIFADVVKWAMERGIDVPRIIADQLKKRR